MSSISLVKGLKAIVQGFDPQGTKTYFKLDKEKDASGTVFYTLRSTTNVKDAGKLQDIVNQYFKIDGIKQEINDLKAKRKKKIVDRLVILEKHIQEKEGCCFKIKRFFNPQSADIVRHESNLKAVDELREFIDTSYRTLNSQEYYGVAKLVENRNEIAEKLEKAKEKLSNAADKDKEACKAEKNRLKAELASAQELVISAKKKIAEEKNPLGFYRLEKTLLEKKLTEVDKKIETAKEDEKAGLKADKKKIKAELALAKERETAAKEKIEKEKFPREFYQYKWNQINQQLKDVEAKIKTAKEDEKAGLKADRKNIRTAIAVLRSDILKIFNPRRYYGEKLDGINAEIVKIKGEALPQKAGWFEKLEDLQKKTKKERKEKIRGLEQRKEAWAWAYLKAIDPVAFYSRKANKAQSDLNALDGLAKDKRASDHKATKERLREELNEHIAELQRLNAAGDRRSSAQEEIVRHPILEFPQTLDLEFPTLVTVNPPLFRDSTEPVVPHGFNPIWDREPTPVRLEGPVVPRDFNPIWEDEPRLEDFEVVGLQPNNDAEVEVHYNNDTEVEEVHREWDFKELLDNANARKREREEANQRLLESAHKYEEAQRLRRQEQDVVEIVEFLGAGAQQ
jgi:hypothetical protein